MSKQSEAARPDGGATVEPIYDSEEEIQRTIEEEAAAAAKAEKDQGETDDGDDDFGERRPRAKKRCSKHRVGDSEEEKRSQKAEDSDYKPDSDEPDCKKQKRKDDESNGGERKRSSRRTRTKSNGRDFFGSDGDFDFDEDEDDVDVALMEEIAEEAEQAAAATAALSGSTERQEIPPEREGREFPVNRDSCHVCDKGGELLCCDKCPKSFHLGCLEPPLEKVPEGSWVCPVCTGVGITPLQRCDRCGKKCEAKQKFVTCGDCGMSLHVLCLPIRKPLGQRTPAVPTPVFQADGKTWLCDVCKPNPCEKCFQMVAHELQCSNCGLSWHRRCAGTPTAKKHASEWTCLDCTSRKKVERILGHRKSLSRAAKTPEPASSAPPPETPDIEREVSISKTPDPSAPEEKKAPPPPPPKSPTPITQPEELEFFVKWSGLSHLHDSWIPQRRMLGLSSRLLRHYYRKHVIAGDSGAEDEGGEDSDGDLEDVVELVRTEWTQVDRVLASRMDDGRPQFFVKWRGLGYDEATWEIAENLAGFREEVEQYRRINDTEKLATRPKPRPPNPATFTEMTVQPSYIPLELFPYQREGCSWLLFSWHQRRNVILADEMGLGKTITCIAFLSVLVHEQMIPGPFLIVAPLSTITNWEREFKLWGPHFNVVTYVGSAKSRDIIRSTEFWHKPSPQREAKFDVLLTSYDIALVDSSALRKFAWQALIIDEGHRLKNRKSKLFEALEPFKTSWRMLMTGTPLQNDLQELFNMFRFLQIEGFEDPEKLFEAEYASLAERDVIKRLHDVLRPHMLRRLKGDVFKNMPEKSEYLVQVDLSPLQKQYYKAVLTKNYEFLRSASKNVHAQAKLLNTLSALQKVCNHPYLMPGTEPTGLTHDEEFKRLAEASGKLALVDKMLAKLRQQGHRVLLFSQQTTLLDIIEDFVRYREWPYSRIDGMTRGEERQERIDLFNKDNSPLFLLLLSTRACRLGINLATADTVIIYDSDWNPHNDIQALSRAHRIGQRKKVMVYQLVSRHTVEEKIVERARSKLLLEHVVVQKMKDEFKKGELDELLRYGTKQLFSGDAGSVPALRYDDAEVEKLLDRDHIDDERAAQAKKREAEEAQAAAADDKYFGGFKVARVWAATAGQQATDTEGEAKQTSLPSDQFWDALLQARYKELQEEQQQQLGVGKRVKKSVNYVTPAFSSSESEEEAMKDDKEADEDFEAKAGQEEDDEETSSDELSSAMESDESGSGRRRRVPLSGSILRQSSTVHSEFYGQEPLPGGDGANGSGFHKFKVVKRKRRLHDERSGQTTTEIVPKLVAVQHQRPLTLLHCAQSARGTRGNPIDIEDPAAVASAVDPAVEMSRRQRLLGEAALMASDVTAAISHFNDALKLVPKSVEVLYHRARAYTAASMLSAALTDLRDVLQQRPGFSPAYILMAHIYSLAGPAHYNELITVYKYAIKQLPHDSDMQIRLRQIIDRSRQPQQPLQQPPPVPPPINIETAQPSSAATTTTATTPTKDPGRTVLPSLSAALSRPTAAPSSIPAKPLPPPPPPPPHQRQTMDAAVVKNTLSQLGFQRKKRLVPSLPAAVQLPAQQQDASMKFKSRGNELLRAGRYKEAAACFSQAISINPWNAALYNNRAAAHLFLEDNVSAAADCEVAIALDPAHYRALCNLGTAYLGLGKYRDAIEYGFLWALELQPTNEDVRCGIDQALLKLGLMRNHPPPSTF